MANSDNVLRCGLTPKHVDIPALLKITDFTELSEPRWPVTVDGFGAEFAVPVPDFALHLMDVIDVGSTSVRLAGPSIALCTSGSVTVEAAGTSVELGPGRAAFVVADESFTLSGKGKLFVAGVGSLA
jgi:mannose-6-phosphate isomerase